MIAIFSKIISKYLFYLTTLLTLPFAMAAYYQFFSNTHPQVHSTSAFLVTIAITLLLATLLHLIGKRAKEELYHRDCILLVVLMWILTAILCSLPFSVSRTLSPLNAYFEAMSGLTTTGATVISTKEYDFNGEEIPIQRSNPHTPEKTYTFYGTVAPIRDPQTGEIEYFGVEAVGKALLFWRSLLQWVGGMGIIVIFLAVLPVLGVGGKLLYRMETAGSLKDEISPRIRETASKLWKLYSFFTLLLIALFVLTNPKMPFFDALCNALTTISTGGFSVRNHSILSYDSSATQALVMIFMILGSINFAFYFQLMRFKFSRIYVPDFYLFISIACAGCIGVSLCLIPELGFFSAFKEGTFQALSFQTTAGFFSANYDLWAPSAQMLMLILMFIGGMSGSTAGGIKTSRIYIAYKILTHRLESIFRPDTVRKLFLGKSEIDDKNALTVLVFFCLVVFFVVVGATLFIFDGVDPETSIGLISCLLNNVGIAFRAAGPLESLAFLSPFSKLVATFWMLLGRLEFFVILLLFLPSFWQND